jgi:hypothetical protein
MSRDSFGKNYRPDTSAIPYKANPGDAAIEAYLEREVKSGQLFGPFNSAEECFRDLMRPKESRARKKRRRD